RTLGSASFAATHARGPQMSSLEPTCANARPRSSYRKWAVVATVAVVSALVAGSSVPVSAATPGPSIAYGFNEGAGTTVGDSSGNARNGAAVGTTWASAGRYGSALSFNGSSSRVTSSAPVSLGSAFTLMTWVLNP